MAALDTARPVRPPTTKAHAHERLIELAAQKRITLRLPLLLSFVRLPLAFLAQMLTVVVLLLAGNAAAWTQARPLWIVSGTLVDLACLALIGWSMRREGARLRDLLGVDRAGLGRDLLLGLGLFAVAMPLAVLGQVVCGILLYGGAPPSALGVTPMWAAWYGVLIFPIIWGVTEELTYRGYALPRLEAVLGSAWAAVLITTLGNGLQHIALPFIPDARFMAYRFASALPIAILFGVYYLRRRRLLPMIVAHWGINVVGIFIATVLPLLAQ